MGGCIGTAIDAVALTVLTLNMPDAWRTITKGLVLLALLSLYGRQRNLRS